MTTRIRIINFGPDRVHVQVRNNDGFGIGVNPIWVQPGGVSDELFVYDDHHVYVIEENPFHKAEKKAGRNAA